MNSLKETKVPTTERPFRASVLELRQQQGGDQEKRLLRWVVGITKSNERLITTLEHLRDSYSALLGEKHVKGSSELICQIERALSDARKARNLIMPGSSPGKQGT